MAILTLPTPGDAATTDVWGTTLNTYLNALTSGSFNVRIYGATGDGATNDAAAIQAAIDAAETAGGGIVYFPPGQYELGSTTLTVDADSVWLVGAGREASELQYEGTGAAISIGTSGGQGRDYCGIQGLYVLKEGTVREAGSIGIVQYSGQSLCIRDVWINSFETGIFLDGDGEDAAYSQDIVQPNLDFVRISGPKIGLKIGKPVTAASVRALHIVGEAGPIGSSIGIQFEADAGQGNYFSQVAIEIMVTGVDVGGNQQMFDGLRLESCTTGVAWVDATADNCTFYGAHFFSCGTDFETPPAGCNNHHICLNGEMHHLTDASTATYSDIFYSGATEHVKVGYTPGASGYMTFYKSAVADILRLMYSDLKVLAYSALEAGDDGARRGTLCLWDGAGGNTPAYVRLHSPNGTAWYLFVEDDGTVKVHNAAPTQNSDGSEIGAQT